MDTPPKFDRGDWSWLFDLCWIWHIEPDLEIVRYTVANWVYLGCKDPTIQLMLAGVAEILVHRPEEVEFMPEYRSGNALYITGEGPTLKVVSHRDLFPKTWDERYQPPRDFDHLKLLLAEVGVTTPDKDPPERVGTFHRLPIYLAPEPVPEEEDS